MQNGFWQTLTTGKDNRSHDPIRVALVGFCFAYLVAFFWGIGMVTAAFFTGREFSLMGPYEAFGVLSTSFGVFCLQGAGSLLMKIRTEPDAPGAPPQTSGTTVVGIGNTVTPDKGTPNAS